MIAVGMKDGIKGPAYFELAEPKIEKANQVLIRLKHAGFCGTDLSMIHYDLRDFPPGEGCMVLGHEAVGVVTEVADRVKTVKPGDWVAPTVRRGCGECASCLNRQSDMCFTGKFKERGIHKLHGFFTEFVVEEEQDVVKVPETLGRLGVLTEPTSITTKAIEEIKFIQTRLPWACSYDPHHKPEASEWSCKTALVFGGGPIGFLAMAQLRLVGMRTFLLENKDEDHIKVKLAKKMGAEYIDSRKISVDKICEITGPLDVIIEASGVAELALDLISILGRNGVYIFTGVPRGAKEVKIDGNMILRQTVRHNQVILGCVNSNRTHFQIALDNMKKIQTKFPNILESVITSHIPISDEKSVIAALLERDRTQIKVVLDLDHD